MNYFNQTFNDANRSFDTRSYGLFLSPDALIKGKPILGAPNIIISGFEQIGITPPQGRNDITGMLTDIVSYTVGRHQFRFGGEFRQGRVDEFYFRHSLGKFNVRRIAGTVEHRDRRQPQLRRVGSQCLLPRGLPGRERGELQYFGRQRRARGVSQRIQLVRTGRLAGHIEADVESGSSLGLFRTSAQRQEGPRRICPGEGTRDPRERHQCDLPARPQSDWTESRIRLSTRFWQGSGCPRFIRYPL